MFIGGTDAEAETPILWPPNGKSWLIWEDLDVGKDWGQEEKGTTENEMVGWHHWHNGHGFGWTPGVGDGQGGLACPGAWGCRARADWVTELNWTNTVWLHVNYICKVIVSKSSLIHIIGVQPIFWEVIVQPTAGGMVLAAFESFCSLIYCYTTTNFSHKLRI